MTNTQKFNGLDHLRALAIIVVFLFHYSLFPHPDWLTEVAAPGWAGVDLFFVLSGFLICNQLYREFTQNGSIQLKLFFTKRAFRILPPYLATLTLYFLMPAFREREALPPLWKFLTFTQNIGLDVVNKGTFSHAWSLCIEEQFYLTLPLLLPVFLLSKWGKKPLLVTGSFLILVLLFRIAAWYMAVVPGIGKENFYKIWYQWIYYPTPTRLDGLVVGVLLAILYNRATKAPKKSILLIAGAIILTAAYFICKNPYALPGSTIGFSLVALGWGMIVFLSVLPGSFIYKRKFFITTELARLSYSIYLTHKGIIHLTQDLLEKYGIDKSAGLTLISCITACILTAYIFRYLIEQPAKKMRDLILKKWEQKNNKPLQPAG